MHICKSDITDLKNIDYYNISTCISSCDIGKDVIMYIINMCPKNILELIPFKYKNIIDYILRCATNDQIALILKNRTDIDEMMIYKYLFNRNVSISILSMLLLPCHKRITHTIFFLKKDFLYKQYNLPIKTIDDLEPVKYTDDMVFDITSSFVSKYNYSVINAYIDIKSKHDLNIIKYLVDYGVPIIHTRSGKTPLHLYLTNICDGEIILYLLAILDPKYILTEQIEYFYYGDAQYQLDYLGYYIVHNPANIKLDIVKLLYSYVGDTDLPVSYSDLFFGHKNHICYDKLYYINILYYLLTISTIKNQYLITEYMKRNTDSEFMFLLKYFNINLSLLKNEK
jgi:hypothetical protein